MEENKNPMTEEATATEADIQEAAAEEAEATEAETKEETDPKEGRADKKKSKKLEAELAEVKKALAAKDAELADANEKYLRLCAEYDNFRKRTAKEKESTYADAVCDALTGILPVLDNLERAAQYNTDDLAETAMGTGLALTLKSFSELLAKMGVSEIPAVGVPFDPNVHSAVMHVEDESLPENTVCEVFMKGYAKGDKVLRYAMVKVAN